MHRFLATGALASIVGGAICLLLAVAPPQRVASRALANEQSAPEVIDAAAASKAFAYVGVATCATGNCHGGARRKLQDPQVFASAYTMWSQDDKRHSGAFRILRGERSQQIAKLLSERMQRKAAHESRLCLDCHSMQGRAADQPLTTAQLSEGVGCESCHGAAEKWYPVHFREPWKKMNDAAKVELGFVPLKNLVNRTKACVDCHIGNSNQDVNHDLIAAGHPRMSFEFSAFYQALPKHWNTKSDQAQPAFDARAWAVGQAQSMSAAARLLAARADKAATKHGVWPEFAEFDCFACHHDLENTSWRRKKPAGALLGLPRWGTFYFAFDKLAGESDSLLKIDGKAASDALTTLSKSAQSSWRGAEITLTKQEALAAAEQLEAWSTRLNDPEKYSAASIRELMTKLVDGGADSSREWDGAFQLFNGLTAMCDAENSLNKQPAVRQKQIAALKDLRAQLKFPDNFNSPPRYTPDGFQVELAKFRSLFKPAE